MFGFYRGSGNDYGRASGSCGNKRTLGIWMHGMSWWYVTEKTALRLSVAVGTTGILFTVTIGSQRSCHFLIAAVDGYSLGSGY